VSVFTGKSLSEVLIFASTNPQYEGRIFIELQVQYMKIPSSENGENMFCTESVFDIQNNFCTKHVLPHFLQKEELLTNIYLYKNFLLVFIPSDPAKSLVITMIIQKGF
jgi:hypothetical protein